MRLTTLLTLVALTLTASPALASPTEPATSTVIGLASAKPTGHQATAAADRKAKRAFLRDTGLKPRRWHTLCKEKPKSWRCTTDVRNRSTVRTYDIRVTLKDGQVRARILDRGAVATASARRIWTHKYRRLVKAEARAVAMAQCYVMDSHLSDPSFIREDVDPDTGTVVRARYVCRHIYADGHLGWSIPGGCNWGVKLPNLHAKALAVCFPFARVKLWKHREDGSHPRWRTANTFGTGGVAWQRTGHGIRRVNWPVWLLDYAWSDEGPEIARADAAIFGPWTAEFRKQAKRKARHAAHYYCQVNDDTTKPKGHSIPDEYYPNARYKCDKKYLDGTRGWFIAKGPKGRSCEFPAGAPYRNTLARCFPKAVLRSTYHKIDDEHPLWKIFSSANTGGMLVKIVDGEVFSWVAPDMSEYFSNDSRPDKDTLSIKVPVGATWPEAQAADEERKTLRLFRIRKLSKHYAHNVCLSKETIGDDTVRVKECAHWDSGPCWRDDRKTGFPMQIGYCKAEFTLKRDHGPAMFSTQQWTATVGYRLYNDGSGTPDEPTEHRMKPTHWLHGKFELGWKASVPSR